MILVTGGTGQLGTAFRSILNAETWFPTRAELDLSRPEAIGAIVAERHPTSIINCAAYTAVDAAEADEKAAHVVNALSVAVLAECAAAAAIPFVTFSTDYVFDGSGDRPYLESDQTRPISAYGRTKREGERLALEANPGALVIRTSWVISATHSNFVDTILRRAPEQELRVVDDQRGCPTFVDDLAPAALEALLRGTSGVLHITNEGATTWFHLAREAAHLAGIETERISPCSTDEFPRPAPRPANSVLGSERREPLGLDPLPHWRQTLPGVVVRLQQRTAPDST